VAKNKTPFIQMPRLYNVFNMPEVKAVRAVTSLRSNVDLGEALKRSSRAQGIREVLVAFRNELYECGLLE